MVLFVCILLLLPSFFYNYLDVGIYDFQNCVFLVEITSQKTNVYLITRHTHDISTHNYKRNLL